MKHAINQNQANPPRKGCVYDSVWKVYFKTPDGVTVPMFDKLHRYQANHKVEVLRKLYNDWKGHFIVSK